jgi:hypothetical protein
MKKIEIIMLISLLALFSCKKETAVVSNATSSTTMNVADLPAAVTIYISDNYPDATIYSALKISNGQASYIVTLSTEEQLAFDGRGNCLGDGQDFEGGGGHHPGDDSLHHGHGHPGHGCPGNWINIDSLPDAIKKYISTNYPDWQTWHAQKDSVCPAGAVITVMIRKTGTHPPETLKLFFDLSNNYLMMGQRIRFMDVPQAVKDYITTNFPNIHKCERSEKLTLPDNSLNFAVFLGERHERHQRIVLTDTGILVCEQ